MNIEDLEEMTKYTSKNKEERLFQEAIRAFLGKYICIPKGSKIQVSKKETISMASLDDWITVSEFRVKPSEPTYEWQYLIYTMFEAKENKLSKFLTDDEFNSMTRSRSEGWIKIQETKRERKQ